MAFGLSRLAQSMLFGVTGSPPAIVGAAAAVVVVVACMAGVVPARRAARINPVEALRSE
jgi:ABC-type antimicrobial peptide transport system permease subunit